MKVFLFSDKKTTQERFHSVQRSKTHELFVYSLAELKEVMKSEEADSLVYVDVTGMEKKKREQTLRFLKKEGKERASRYAVVDGKDVIADPAALFHDGAVDYIGKELLKEEVSTKRIAAVAEFLAEKAGTVDAGKEAAKEAGKKAAGKGKTARKESSSTEKKASPAGKKKKKTVAGTKMKYTLSGPGWKKVKAGKEYTFCFMYAELDLHSDWQKKSGKLHLDKVGTEFHSLIEKTVAPLEGKIWMWNDFSGVALLPFDGSSCEALLSAFRLILNRSLISTELFRYQILMSYRIALEIGNTVYHPRGNTGTLISDTVNFLFHLGKKFAKPGNLYLTDTVTPFIPEGLQDYFLPAGTFEGREITRMLLPEE